MAGTTAPAEVGKADGRDEGYDIELSTRTLAELRRHMPQIDQDVFKALENLHLLDRMVGTEAWQHYQRFHATPNAIVAVRAKTGPKAGEDRRVLPYDDLAGSVRTLLADRWATEPRDDGRPHRLFGQFRQAMRAYSDLTEFQRGCEAMTGAALPDSQPTVN